MGDDGGSGDHGDVSDVFSAFLLQCNNPKTKEPKLTAAVRIVPEWVEYDNEIKELLKQVQEEGDPKEKHPTPSQNNKGSYRKLKTHLFLSFFLTSLLFLYNSYIFTFPPLSAADNVRDEL